MENDIAKKENAKRIKDNNVSFEPYQEIIANQKKSIRNLWWAFVIMSVAWLVLLIAYIMK